MIPRSFISVKTRARGRLYNNFKIMLNFDRWSIYNSTFGFSKSLLISQLKITN